MFDFCSTALKSAEGLDRKSFALRAGPQGSSLGYPSAAWLTELTELAGERKQFGGFGD